MLIGLREAVRLHLALLIPEGDSSYVIKWATSSCAVLWQLENVFKELSLSLTAHPCLLLTYSEKCNEPADAYRKVLILSFVSFALGGLCILCPLCSGSLCLPLATSAMSHFPFSFHQQDSCHLPFKNKKVTKLSYKTGMGS